MAKNGSVLCSMYLHDYCLDGYALGDFLGETVVQLSASDDDGYIFALLQ